LLVYAFGVVENNEINLEIMVDDKTAELVSLKLKEHEELDRLRRQHTPELITGARRLSEKIHDGIDKPLKDSLNYIFLMKQNPDLCLAYTDSIEAYLEEVSNIQKKTSVGKLKKGFEDISEIVQKAVDGVHMPVCLKVVYESEFHAVSVDPVKMFLVFENLIDNAVEALGFLGFS
jgi:signal transduction histidine kinase